MFKHHHHLFGNFFPINQLRPTNGKWLRGFCVKASNIGTNHPLMMMPYTFPNQLPTKGL